LENEDSIAEVDGYLQIGAESFLVPTVGGFRVVRGEAERREHISFPEYRRELESASWPGWYDVNLLFYLIKATGIPSEFDIEIRRRPLNLWFDFTVTLKKEGVTIFSWEANSETAVLMDGGIIYFTSFSQIATGMTVVAYDYSAGREIWRRELRGIGPVFHSKYRNWGAHLEFADGAIRVKGKEGGSGYLEYVRLDNGETIANKVFPLSEE
jgi:hypothetical protein